MTLTNDDQLRQHRERNFGVRAEPTREPDFDGEQTIYLTYNGRQEFPFSLAPHEAHQLMVLLQAQFQLPT